MSLIARDDRGIGGAFGATISPGDGPIGVKHPQGEPISAGFTVHTVPCLELQTSLANCAEAGSTTPSHSSAPSSKLTPRL